MTQMASFNEELIFNEKNVAIKVIMETETSKEIRILFRKNQEMKEHQTAFPITVHILKGKISFGVNGEKMQLSEGDIIALKPNTPHDLLAMEDSVVRLSLSKLDKIERVYQVIK